MPSPDHVLRELRSLPARYNLSVRKEGAEAWVACPYHANGAEKVPSLKVNIKSNEVPPGVFYCFGCTPPTHGPWNKLAEALNLKKDDGSRYYPDKLEDHASETERDHITGRKLKPKATYPKGSMLWSPQHNWRNINGETVVACGGHIFHDPKTQKTQMYLPIIVHGEFIGGVKCNIVPVDGINYFNDPGMPIKTKGLVPYDLVAQLLKDQPYLVLVEGPRDALNLLQHGIPCLATLGAGNAITESKLNRVLELQPKIIVLAFDPDEAGDAAAEKCKEFFKGHAKIITVRFPYKWVIRTYEDGHKKRLRKKIKDASDMSKAWCDKLKQRIEAKLPEGWKRSSRRRVIRVYDHKELSWQNQRRRVTRKAA